MARGLNMVNYLKGKTVRKCYTCFCLVVKLEKEPENEFLGKKDRS